MEFNAKKYFQTLQKIKNLLFTVKISFLHSTMEWWMKWNEWMNGMMAHQGALLKYV